MHCTTGKKRQHGFTLVELMIAVAIIGILGAIAYPSYVEHVRRGQRAEARTALLQAAQWMERGATATGLYPTSLPGALQSVSSGRYTISANIAADGSTFTLTATPSSSATDSKCGSFTLSNTGLRGANGTTTGDVVKECWGK